MNITQMTTLSNSGDLVQDLLFFVNATSEQGSALYQKERIRIAAEWSLKHYSGDLIEIGAYIGETTVVLCELARKYHRKVIVVDPWAQGTQNCVSDEYEQFCQRTAQYGDVLHVIRASSVEEKTIETIKASKLAFAFIDGLHTVQACQSDYEAVKHCEGVICVDDLVPDQSLLNLFYNMADSSQRTHFAFHHRQFREGFLIPVISPLVSHVVEVD